jgi:hypothetical protein
VEKPVGAEALIGAVAILALKDPGTLAVSQTG